MQREVEREVVRMSKSGDPRSYAPLVRAYEGAGLRLAVGMLGSDALDARSGSRGATPSAHATSGRISSSMIQIGAAEMLCYGTAVIIEADG